MRDVKILSDRMLRIKGSAEHSRWTCVDRPSRFADEQLYNNAPHRKCLRKKTTACVILLVFFRIRRSIFPYSAEDDTSTIVVESKKKVQCARWSSLLAWWSSLHAWSLV